ncbi:MAG: acyl-CoA dehydrogenase family protein, partial [Leptospiraceae bacterium]|nr:acyl-CoA dehydrogenase family protein [Leptospiraceae bacterium]
MIQGNYFTEDPDLVFIFDHVLDWEKIVHACEGKDFIEHKEYLETNNSRLEMAPSSVEEAKDLYKSTLNLLGDFFGNEVTPFTSTFDKKGLKYQDGKVIFPEEMIAVYEKVKDTGLLPYAISRKAGGLGFPMAIAGFYTLIMARADSPLSMAINLLNLAQIIYRYGTYEQIEKFVVPATKGEKLFAMSLTEPDYGSDLNSVRSTATKNGNGNYKINGTKRFISQGCGLGDRPAVLLTLARTGKQGGGARGLSLFITTSDKVEVAGIEHKMGIHASPTCELVYENTDGELLADEGVGLTRCTLGMTNFMRLGTAAGGAGGGAAAYYESLKYASEREQFGKPIKDITAVKEMLAKIRRETNAMRLFTVHTGVAVDMYQHEQIRKEKAGISDREIRQDIEIRKWNQIASVLTPMAKYYCSEEGNRVAY